MPRRRWQEPVPEPQQQEQGSTSAEDAREPSATPKPAAAPAGAEGPPAGAPGSTAALSLASETFTAVVAADRIGNQRVGKQADRFAQKAFFILDRDTFPRKQCIQLYEKKWFDPFILTLIMLNCLTMIVRARSPRHVRHAALRARGLCDCSRVAARSSLGRAFCRCSPTR